MVETEIKYCKRYPSIFIGVGDNFSKPITFSRCCLLKFQPLYECTFEEYESLLNNGTLFSKLEELVNVWPPENERTHPFLEPYCQATCFWPKMLKLENVSVSLAGNCNLKCRFCGTKIKRDKHHSELLYLKDLQFRTLDALRGHNIKSLSMTELGEPLFFTEDLNNFLNKISHTDFKSIEFITNATMLKPETVNIIKNSDIFYTFNVSLNAWDRESYKKIMGADLFDKALNNAFILKKLPNVSMSMSWVYDCKSSLPKIQEFVKILENQGIGCRIYRKLGDFEFTDLPEDI